MINTLNANGVKPTGQFEWNEKYQISKDEWRNFNTNVFLLVKKKHTMV